MPTPSFCRAAVIAVGLLGSGQSFVRADEGKALSVSDMVAAVAPAVPQSAGTDLAVASAKLSQALNKEYAGKTVTFQAGLIIQIITEGGGVKLVSFPPADAEKGTGRSLGYAVLSKEEEAGGKKLSPGDAVTVRGKVISVSAKVEEDSAGKPLSHVRVTMEDAAVTDAKLKPRKKPASAATQPAK